MQNSDEKQKSHRTIIHVRENKVSEMYAYLHDLTFWENTFASHKPFLLLIVMTLLEGWLNFLAKIEYSIWHPSFPFEKFTELKQKLYSLASTTLKLTEKWCLANYF